MPIYTFRLSVTLTARHAEEGRAVCGSIVDRIVSDFLCVESAEVGEATSASAPAPVGPFYVMLDHEQSADECATLEAARESGRRILASEPLACSVSICDADGEHVEDIGDNFAQTVGAGVAFRAPL